MQPGQAWRDTKDIEARSRAIILPYIRSECLNGQFVETDKGRLSLMFQKEIGDVIANNRRGDVVSIEIKAEVKNTHGNFFLETWSNKKWETWGWMFALDADLLLYHFIEDDAAWLINFQDLQRWAYTDEFKTYPEKMQQKHRQQNDTWGRCVPISAVERAIPHRRIKPSEFIGRN